MSSYLSIPLHFGWRRSFCGYRRSISHQIWSNRAVEGKYAIKKSFVVRITCTLLKHLIHPSPLDFLQMCFCCWLMLTGTVGPWNRRHWVTLLKYSATLTDTGRITKRSHTDTRWRFCFSLWRYYWNPEPEPVSDPQGVCKWIRNISYPFRNLLKIQRSSAKFPQGKWQSFRGNNTCHHLLILVIKKTQMALFKTLPKSCI